MARPKPYSPKNMESLVEMLRYRARYQANRRAFIFLSGRCRREYTLTYGQLDSYATAVASMLREECLGGDRVLLLYPPGADYVTAFFGCLYAGMTAVPLYPPRPNQRMFRVDSVIQNSGATIALTNRATLPNIEGFVTANERHSGMRLRTTDDLPAVENEDPLALPEPEGIAFLQYTSGSTGSPKGAMVTHDNIMANLAVLRDKIGSHENSVFVHWLPLYHDMGLINSVFHPIYSGCLSVLIPPISFIQKPLCWLQAISKYRGTICGGPNFGFELCMRKISAKQIDGLDLSSWVMAFNGAEPIHAATLDRFVETFASAGFPPTAIYPCYGMAESTLLVSGGDLSKPHVIGVFDHDLLTKGQGVYGRPGSPTQTVTGCGNVGANHKLCIVNPETMKTLEDGYTGEIWLQGRSVVAGYWGLEQETRQTFQATPVDAPGSGQWLRTGDLAFVKDNELYITGRLKDLVIIRGRNYAPTDIEATAARCIPGLRVDGVAAFSVDVAGEERLVVLQEVERRAFNNMDSGEAIEAIRAAVAEAHELQTHAVLLLKQGGVPKTSSGKIQRALARKQYLEDQLQVIDSDTLQTIDVPDDLYFPNPETLMATPVEERPALLTVMMRAMTARALRIKMADITPTCSLNRFGIDSMTAMEVQARLEAELAIHLPIYDFLSGLCIEDLVAKAMPQLADQDSAGGNREMLQLKPMPAQRYSPFPLTDIQYAYWIGRGSYFQLGNTATYSYIEFELEELDLGRFNEAWRSVIARHDMLRAVIHPSGDQQVLETVPHFEVVYADLRELEQGERDKTLTALREEMSHQILPAERWPLFDIRVSQIKNDHYRLHMGMDLLIVDAWSILLVIDELVEFYDNPKLSLPTPKLSFRDYVLAEKTGHEGKAYGRARNYWMARLEDLPPAPDLPLEINPATITRPRFVRRQATLPPEKWKALKQRGEALGVTPSFLLAAIFADTLRIWSKSPRMTLNLTLFNRLPLHQDVNDIVGDFTSTTLLETDNSGCANFAERVAKLQNQLWRDLDNRRFSGASVLRELHQQRGENAAMPVVFTSILPQGFYNKHHSGIERLGKWNYSVSQTPQVWLDHQVMEVNGELRLSWDAIDELFPTGLLDDMFAAHMTWIGNLAEDQNCWKSGAAPRPPAAQLEARTQANATQSSISEQLLHTLFTSQVPRFVNRVAVFSPRRNLTYGELNEQATRIGRRLRKEGAEPNTLIAVVMEKGWEQVVAVYGILQAGAAYMPVDAKMPEIRRNALLADGKCRIALTQARFRNELNWPEDVIVHTVDSTEFENEDAAPLNPVQKTTDLAYVIYTSGSTGKPKGVIIDHRGAVNTILDINSRFEVGPEDRVFAISQLSFDLSVYDIFGLLAVGGAMVIPEADADKDPLHWSELAARHRVTIWNSVPVLLQMLVEDLSSRNMFLAPELRLTMMSGDWIPLSLPNRIKAMGDGVRVVSLGGATEASIWSILYEVGDIETSWKSIPYGKPMVNQTFHVLNDQLEPCPVWTPGHLYIGGIGLALGYWADETRTNERFIVHPITGDRLYKTGDLGRYYPDGNIEFLGRDDFQVKVGGFRIELGEIEAAFEAHPDVKDAVVTAFGDPRGNKQVAAYITRPQQDSVEETPFTQLAETQSLLTDRLERAQFKFDQRGLRALDGKTTALARPDDEESAYLARQSFREFLDEPLTAEAFGFVLAGFAQAKRPEWLLPKMRYPSAGSLCPVQIYLSIKENGVEGLAPGYYYYHPSDHSLIQLHCDDSVEKDIHETVNRAAYSEALVSLYMVGDLDAITPLYGNLARDFCMLEAGYMSQLLLENAAVHNVGFCPIGALNFEPLRTRFQLSESHVFLHAHVGGVIDPAWKTEWRAQVQLSKKSDVRPTVEPLREFVKTRLPDYMVPRFILVMDHLPLTSNGKVDRKALPEPDAPELGGRTLVAPRNDLEARLAAIWEEILVQVPLGVTENFFELGGHSLLATRVVTAVCEGLGAQLKFREFFGNPTIEGLASLLAERLHTASDLVPLVALPRTSALPLSYSQQRLFFFEQLNPGAPDFNMSYAISIQGPMDRDMLAAGFKALILRHEALRTNFRLLDGVPSQVINTGEDWTMEIQDLTGLPESQRAMEVRERFQAASRRGYSMADDHLFRITLLALSDTEHVLLMSTHHITSDGWSVGVILSELITIYTHGKDTTLPPMPIQYPDYAVWQRRRFDEGEMDSLISYWKGKLKNAPRLILPKQASQNVDQSDRSGAVFEIKLTPKITRDLMALAHEEDDTLFTVLLSALKTLLYRQTGQTDIVLGTNVANRNHSELAGLVGFFVNLLALRSDLSGNPTFRELLVRMRQELADAYTHEELPFDKVVTALRLERDLGDQPLVQAALVMQKFPFHGKLLPDQKWRMMPSEVIHSRFELAVLVTDPDIFNAEKEEGLVLQFVYRKALFGETIPKLAHQYEKLLHLIVDQPDLRLNDYKLMSQSEKENKLMQKKERKAFQAKGLRSARRRSASLGEKAMVSKVPALENRPFPLVVSPNVSDIDLAEWAEGDRETLRKDMLKHGALLFRGFGVVGVGEFARVARSLADQLYGGYGDLPMENRDEKVYRSTPYPNNKSILHHNESSHMRQWPMRQFFHCVKASHTGGETPLTDCRELYRVLDPALRTKFHEKGLLYQRNFTQGLDVSWQDFFQTDDKDLVERKCTEDGMTFEWLSNDGLRTRQLAPAVIQHPITKEWSFFNQIQLHHIGYLGDDVRASLSAVFKEEEFPRNVYFGDGEPLSAEEIDTVTRLYNDNAVVLPWQEGDVLAVDNMLMAHARLPFEGDRKIIVAMGDLVQANTINTRLS